MLAVRLLGLVWFVMAIVTLTTGGSSDTYWAALIIANVCWVGVLIAQAVIKELRRTVESEETK